MPFVNLLLTKTTFFVQLIVFTLVITLIPLLSLSFWQYNTFEQAIIQTQKERLWALAQDKRQIIQQKTLSDKHIVQQLGMSSVVSAAMIQAKDNLLQESIDTKTIKRLSSLLLDFKDTNQYDRVFIVNSQGKIVFTQQDDFELGKQLTDEDAQQTALGRVYRKVVQQQSAVVEGYAWYDLLAKAVSFIASPIVDAEGVQYGYIIAQHNNHWLLPVVEQTLGLGVTGELILGYLGINNQTNLLIYPKNHDGTRSTKPQKSLKNEQKALTLAVQGQEGTGENTDYQSNAILSAWLYEPELNIGLLVKQDLNEVLQPVEAQFAQMQRMILLVVMLVILLGIWINYRIAKPINSIAKHVQDLGNKIHIPPLSHNLAQSKELGTLVTGVNQTAIQITSQMNLLTTQAERIEEQAQKLQLTNYLLEQKVQERTEKLQEYISLVDREVLTSRTDEQGNITYISAAFCRISGYSQEELIGQNHRLLRHPNMPAQIYQQLWKSITSGQSWTGELKNLRKDGSSFWVDAVISPTFAKEGSILGYMAVLQDISDKKRIERLSITDPMTGLYNRRYFNAQIEVLWQLACNESRCLALLMLDVDFFKRYNDSMGHQAGDTALIAVADTLHLLAKETHHEAFRLGGEEMAMLLLANTPEHALEQAKIINQRLVDLAIPHPSSDAAPVLTASIGICYVDARREQNVPLDAKRLYLQADEALYHAKESGRNQSYLCPEGIKNQEQIASTA